MPTALRVDHGLLAASLVLTALAFTSRSADPVNVIKLTVLMLCAIALVVAAAIRGVQTRVLQVPWGLPAGAALALLLAFVVATITAPVTTTAVLGAYGRNSGLLAYGSAVILFLVGLRVLDLSGVRVLLYALAGTGLVLGVYGLFQLAGIDPVPWANDDFNPIIGTLGNPNFAAAYMAICTPAAAWMALRSDLALPWRIAGGVAAVVALLAAALSDAFQGPLAASAGLFVLAVAWVLGRPEKVRRAGLAVLAALAAIGVATVAAGLAGAGPVAGILSSAGSRARVWYWDAALTMWRDNPVFGVGLDTFGGFWWQAKPLEVVRVVGDSNFVNAAHSVPLHLLATGGALLFVTYAVFVGVVATALVRGLLRLEGRDRLLLGAVGGSWAAYQVQALVSIDQVPLITAQYVCAAGVVVVAGWARSRAVPLPGAPAQRGAATKAAKSGKGRPPVRKPRARVLGPGDYVVIGLVGLLGVVTAWQALKPLRADTAVLAGDRKLAAGDGTASLEAYQRAEELVPGATLPLQRQASLYQRAEMLDQAYASLKEAAEANPYDLSLVRDAAEFAENRGKVDEARRFHQRALELEPDGAGTLQRAALFEMRQGRTTEALALVERAVDLHPNRADVWASLGDVRAAGGDTDGARAAYARALELQPTQEAALAGVAKLDAQA